MLNIMLMVGRGQKDLRDLETVFRALAHESRRHVLVVLNGRGGEMTAGEIANRFACSWPTTSRHLKILVDAGLIRVERRGREWVYVLLFERLHQVVGNWIRWFNKQE